MANMIGLIPRPCEEKRAYSALAGALVGKMGGLPYVNRWINAPGIVHYAVAGAALDLVCRGFDVKPTDNELLWSEGLGVLGELLVSVVNS